MIKLLGVSGKICSGKTTVSKALIERYGYKRVVIAEPIKVLAKWYKDYSLGLVHDNELLTYALRNTLWREGEFTKTTIEKARWAEIILLEKVFPNFKNADWSVEKNNDIRRLYQQIGEEMRQAFGDDVWVTAMIQRIKSDQKLKDTKLFICDDVRQKSEYVKMKDFGFKIIRLDISPGVQADRIKNLYGEIDPKRLLHISEVDLDGVDDFDLVINSDNPTDVTIDKIIEFIETRR